MTGTWGGGTVGLRGVWVVVVVVVDGAAVRVVRCAAEAMLSIVFG